MNFLKTDFIIFKLSFDAQRSKFLGKNLGYDVSKNSTQTFLKEHSKICDRNRAIFVEKYDFSSNAGIFLQFENSRADNCLSFPLLQFCFGVRK